MITVPLKESKGESDKLSPFSLPGFSGVFLGLAAAPLIFFNSLPQDQLYLFPTLVVLALLVLKESVRSVRSLRISVSLVFSVLCISLLVLHSATSIWPWMSWWMGLSLAMMPAGCILGERVLGRAGLNAFVVSLIAVSISNAAVMLGQSFLGEVRAHGFIDDVNLSANIVAIGFLLLLYRYLASGSIWVLFLLYISSSALFFSQSRGGGVAFALALIVILALLFRARKKDYLVSLVWVVVPVALAFVTYLVVSNVYSEPGAGARPGAITARIDLWVATIGLIGEAPWFGSGVGTFAVRYPAVRLFTETISTGNFAHSDYLQLFAEIGILGVLVVVALPIYFVCRVLARAVSGVQGVDGELFVIISAGVFSLIVSHSFVNFIIYHPLVSLSFGVIVGASLREMGGGDFPHLKELSVVFKRWAGWFAFSVLFVSGVMLVADLRVSNVVKVVQGNGEQLSLRSELYHDLMALEYFTPMNVTLKNYMAEAEVDAVLSLEGTGLEEDFRAGVIKKLESNEGVLSPNCVQGSLWAMLIRGESPAAAEDMLSRLIEVAPACYRARMLLAHWLSEDERYGAAVDVLNSAVDRLVFKEASRSQVIALLEQLASALESAGRSDESVTVRAYIRVL